MRSMTKRYRVTFKNGRYFPGHIQMGNRRCSTYICDGADCRWNCTAMFMPLILGLNGIWYSIVVAEFMAVVVGTIFLVAKRKRYRYW